MAIRVTSKGLKDALSNTLNGKGDELVIKVVGEKKSFFGMMSKTVYEIEEK